MLESHAAMGISALVGNITRGQDRLRQRKESLRDARAAADEARAIGQLQAENAELRLYLATIVSLLIFKKVIAREEFQKISAIIDGLDGVVDGRYDGEITADGKIKPGARARGDLALRELAAVVKQKGT